MFLDVFVVSIFLLACSGRLAKSPILYQYTCKKNSRVSLSLGVQIGCAFNSVVVSTGWAFAVDHAFNG